MKRRTCLLLFAVGPLLAPGALAGPIDLDALERLFGAGSRNVGGAPPPPPPPGPGPLSEAHALIGTFAASGSPGASLAILVSRDRAGEQRLLAPGDEIEAGARLTAILPGWVVARREGAGPERIDLNLDAAIPAPARPAPRSPPAYPGIVRDGIDAVRIDPAARERELTRLPELLRSVRSSPVHGPNGALAGFRIHGVEPGSLVAALGLADGDVVTGLDGRPLDDLAVVAELLAGVRTRDRLELEVERAGERRSLRLRIAPADGRS